MNQCWQSVKNWTIFYVLLPRRYKQVALAVMHNWICPQFLPKILWSCCSLYVPPKKLKEFDALKNLRIFLNQTRSLLSDILMFLIACFIPQLKGVYWTISYRFKSTFGIFREHLAMWISQSIKAYLTQASKLSVDFITYFTDIQTKTYTNHVSTLSKFISDKIAAKKRRTPSRIVFTSK